MAGCRSAALCHVGAETAWRRGLLGLCCLKHVETLPKQSQARMEGCGGAGGTPNLAAPGLGEEGQQGQPLSLTALPDKGAERVSKPKMGSDVYLMTCSSRLPNTRLLWLTWEWEGLATAAIWGPTVTGAGGSQGGSRQGWENQGKCPRQPASLIHPAEREWDAGRHTAGRSLVVFAVLWDGGWR